MRNEQPRQHEQTQDAKRQNADLSFEVRPHAPAGAPCCVRLLPPVTCGLSPCDATTSRAPLLLIAQHRARLAGITYDPTLLIRSLQQETRGYQLRSLAPNTWANASTALRTYARYCRITGDYPDPITGITDTQLAQYATYLARSVRHNTVENYVSMGVKRLHDELGMPFKAVSERPAVRATMRGIARVHGRGPIHRKLPITVEILAGIRRHANLTHTNDLSTIACMLTMFHGFLRKGNATWNKPRPGLSEAERATYNQYVITRNDLRKVDGRYHLTVRGTKTIQFGQRQLTIVLPRIRGSEVCPTAILDLYLSHTQGRPAHEPLFGVLNDAGDWVPMDYARLMRNLKAGMAKLGLDPTKYAGHSFRRGGATHAFLAGVPEHLIRLMGDWKSDVWREYTEVQIELRRRAAALVEQSLASRCT